MTIFLIGFMGSGKSTVANLLATDFIDMDAVIVDNIGMPISVYFERYGEPAFRQVESDVLKTLSSSGQIVSTGGGVVSSKENRRILSESTSQVIYLKSNFSDLYARIMADKENVRPLFLEHTKEALEVIYESRKALYEMVATKTVLVTDKCPEDIVKEIQL
ncbi:shikimate kinase [Lactococcus piscium]|uniref:Shikimate kinase n=1 Tax=Pseudolactococcus paracarnosus TaxID=2749962 RepID=A0A7L4WCV7_9LACT|nr:shikimate kinase [Lactococcus paracarnosus]MCJ1994349.1 shikimate kinase [Lactococcus paracarnosus]QDJ28017.1 shikimate kinase [Lactococcus paracarnosus]SPC35614.1 Shikimate kinase [Lactococcus piscium]